MRWPVAVMVRATRATNDAALWASNTKTICNRLSLSTARRGRAEDYHGSAVTIHREAGRPRAPTSG